MSFSSGRTDIAFSLETEQGNWKRHSFFVFSYTLGTSNSDSNTVSSQNVSGQWSRVFQLLAFHSSILPTRSHTGLDIRTELINNRKDGDLQSLWPASSENVLVNLLLLHCGHCLWDWTFPHGSRKQQTDDCNDEHNETILVVRSCSVFTAPPSAHICLKCAYVFTPAAPERALGVKSRTRCLQTSLCSQWQNLCSSTVRREAAGG